MKLPMMLDFQNKNVLIVGGGKIGLRKTITLVDAGANILCVSENFCKAYEEKAKEYSTIIKKKKAFEPSDLKDMDFVIAATDDTRLNQKIYELCCHQHIWCLGVDRESDSDVSFMASRRKEHLTIAVSTDGKSPGFAKKYIRQLSEEIQDRDIEELNNMIKSRNARFEE